MNESESFNSLKCMNVSTPEKLSVKNSSNIIVLSKNNHVERLYSKEDESICIDDFECINDSGFVVEPIQFESPIKSKIDMKLINKNCKEDSLNSIESPTKRIPKARNGLSNNRTSNGRVKDQFVHLDCGSAAEKATASSPEDVNNGKAARKRQYVLDDDDIKEIDNIKKQFVNKALVDLDMKKSIERLEESLTTMLGCIGSSLASILSEMKKFNQNVEKLTEIRHVQRVAYEASNESLDDEESEDSSIAATKTTEIRKKNEEHQGYPLTHTEICAIKGRATSAASFAGYVMDKLFTFDEYTNANVYGRTNQLTKDENKNALDGEKIDYIKRLVMKEYGFSEQNKEEEWRRCVRYMNIKIRRMKEKKGTTTE